MNTDIQIESKLLVREYKTFFSTFTVTFLLINVLDFFLTFYSDSRHSHSYVRAGGYPPDTSILERAQTIVERLLPSCTRYQNVRIAVLSSISTVVRACLTLLSLPTLFNVFYVCTAYPFLKNCLPIAVLYLFVVMTNLLILLIKFSSWYYHDDIIGDTVATEIQFILN